MIPAVAILNRRSKEFNSSGWRLYFKDRQTTLYYVRFKYHNKYYYKIGITTQGVYKRFSDEPVPYDILFERIYKSGQTAYKKEQDIIKKNKAKRYFGPRILKSGNSELFTQDIMKGA